MLLNVSKMFTSPETIMTLDLIRAPGFEFPSLYLGVCVHLCANPPSSYLWEPQLPIKEARITSVVDLTLGGASLVLRIFQTGFEGLSLHYLCPQMKLVCLRLIDIVHHIRVYTGASSMALTKALCPAPSKPLLQNAQI